MPDHHCIILVHIYLILTFFCKLSLYLENPLYLISQVAGNSCYGGLLVSQKLGRKYTYTV